MVAERRRREAERVLPLFDEMETIVADWLRGDWSVEGADPAACLRRYQTCLEGIGVVPPGVVRAVRAVDGRGGAAKISGAGTLAESGGAGCLIVHWPDPDVALPPELDGYRELDFEWGAAGLEVGSGVETA